MQNHIAEHFENYCELLPASTEELKQAVYRLRYQVYCLETGFENPSQFPSELEQDEYDQHSEHCIVRHRQSGQDAATTRLILPDKQALTRPYPIEIHSKLERTDLLAEIPRSRLAEASRFCVSPRFKRREGEQHTLAGIGPHPPKPVQESSGNKRIFANFFTLALIACLVRMSAKHGIDYWYAFMELPFDRLLRGLGINFIPLGPLVEYHGNRRPYLIKVDDLLAGTKSHNVEIWKILTNHESHVETN